MGSKRIGLELFTEELKALFNASAKIFPITQDMVTNNLNPDGYEYGKIERSIYRWSGATWEYIVADDVDIKWTDVSEKPTVFPPEVHDHVDLHTHTNKSLLDSFTQMLVDTWNTVTGKAELVHTHSEADVTNLDKYTTAEINALLLNKAGIVHNHDDAYYTIDEVVTLLATKSDNIHDHATLYSILGHDHDGRYFTESEVNTLLGGKAPLVHTHTESGITDLDKYTQSEVNTLLSAKAESNHTHTDLHAHTNKSILDLVIATEPQTDYDLSQLQYIEDIRAGYTEGHSHSNLTVLGTITQLLIDGWNSAVAHISDAVKHITSAERTLWNTVSSKSDNTHDHDTDYADITHTHVKSDITDLSLAWNDITSKPLVFPPDVHTHDDRYYTESEIDTKLSTKADSTTLSGHTGNTTVHVTQLDKDNWNAKADLEDILPAITVGTVKPTDGSMWYQEV